MKVKTWSLMFLCFVFLCISGCGRAATRRTTTGSERVVSLAPNLTEILAAIGAQHSLAGRTSACDYPDNIAGVPVVGGFGNPSLEVLASLEPTLLLEVDVADASIRTAIDQLGIRRETIPCHSLADIPRAISAVGRLVDHQPEADRLAARLSDEIASLRSMQPAERDRPSVFVEIWNEPLTTVGSNSFVSELVMVAGGKSIGDEIGTESFIVSPEWVVSKDPDIILCLYMTNDQGAPSLVKERLGWKDVSAVRRGNVYGDLNVDTILRPGPRVLLGIAEIRRCIEAARRRQDGEA